MELQELKQVLRQNGVIGAGGAGFPAYAKLDKRIETIVLNCAECEPLLKVHRQLLAKYALEILQALSEIAAAVEAKEVIIAVKGAYKQTVEAVEQGLKHSSLKVPVRISKLPEIYPAGDEVITIYETTGKVVPPGRLPIDVGIAVFNVETMYNAYCALFLEEPVTEKYLTVAGEVAAPVTLKVPIGMRLDDVVMLAGGALCENPVYIHGGPMTGPIAGSGEVVTKTSNAVLVFNENHPVILKKRTKASVSMKRAMASCCQCRMCTDLCPRHLLGHPIEPHAFMRAATTGQTKNTAPFLNTYFCSQCGLCEMYSCNQCLSPKSLIGSYKQGLKQAGVNPPEKPVFKEVSKERKIRKVPMQRLIARLSLTSYDVPAPLTEKEIEAGMVVIKLNQHIGAPAKAVVLPGDAVYGGTVVAKAAEEKLSVSYHSPIQGCVMRADDSCVIIKADNTVMRKG